MIYNMACAHKHQIWLLFSVFAITLQCALSACPSGWVTVGPTNARTCFRLYSGQRKGFGAAHQFCVQQGGYLGRITSQTIHNQMKARIIAAKNSNSHPDSFWIGLNDQNRNNGPWQWVGGPNLGSWTNFQDANPTNTPGSRDCFFVNTGGCKCGEEITDHGTTCFIAETDLKWHVTSTCSTTKAVVCQRDFNASAATTTTQPTITCPAGWNPYPLLQICIRLYDDPVTWTAAQSFCRSTGGDLVKINDSPTNDVIVAEIAAQKSVYWIGLHDRETEKTFKWNDDTDATNFTNWASREPNTGGSGSNENCVYADGNKNSQWVNDPCSNARRYICQHPGLGVTLPSTTPTTPISTNCGAGWEDDPNTDNCYKFSTDMLTWLDARDMCQNLGGDLASIQTVQENFYLSARSLSFSSDFFWIGANDRATEKGWLWSDGTPFAFLNWDDKQPDNAHNSDCVVMVQRSGLWDDVQCELRYMYICEKKGKTTFTPIPTTTPPVHIPVGQLWGCPSGWDNYRGSCYKAVENAIGIDQASANSICSNAANQGALVAIIDDDENNYVKAMFPQGYSGQYGWIGFQDPVENTFNWIDGTPVTYTNWNPGEPNNQNNEDCAGMATNGKWVDIACDRLLNLFICKRPKSLQTITLDTGCYNGSIGYGAQCYTFIQDQLNFNDADNDCRKRSGYKGHLATIDNSQLQGWLSAELDLRPGPTYWIGARQSNYIYGWRSGAPFSFSFFGQNHTGVERYTCVAVQKQLPVGMWANENCNDLRPYLCEAPRPGYSTPTTISTPANLGGCPSPWQTHNTLCYQAFTVNISDALSWPDARAFCKAQTDGANGYGTLVTITDQATEQWIIDKLLGGVNASGTYWIGLNDRDTEAGYEWQDGAGLMYAHWAAGEPNDMLHKEDCVTWNLPANSWNDDYCYIAYNWICQIPRGSRLATTKAPVTGATAPLACGNSSWVEYQGNCYFLSPDDGDMAFATWFDARQICLNMNAELTSIQHEEENGLLTTLMSKRNGWSFWIGLNDLDMVFKWTDNSPVSYVSWGLNEPNDANGEESCVEMGSTGQWNDLHCQDQIGYVCKKLPGGATPSYISPTPASGGCPKGFSSLPALSYCFALGGDTNGTAKNFDDAMAACRQLTPNAQLAAIHSSLDQKYVMTLMQGLSGGRGGGGFRGGGFRRGAWIGLNDRRNRNSFEWLDNSKVDFTNWGPNQPDENLNSDDPTDRRDCVTIQLSYRGGSGAGGWNDMMCTQTLPYICEAKKVSSLPTEAPNTAGCKTGYQRFRNSCYKYDADNYNWTVAEGLCVSDGGHLVSISDGVEQAFVELLTQHVSNLQIWLGLSYDQVNSVFKWSDGWPVRYTNWGTGEPDLVNQQSCGSHTLDGQWQDVPCQMKLSFVCEINLQSAPPPRQAVRGLCPNGTSWFTSGTDCYHLETANPKSWPGAAYACQVLGGNLASIHTDDEAHYITNLISNRNVDVWIGLQKGQGDGFSWNDGSEVEYIYWAPGEPSDPDSYLHQDCVKARVQDGAWADTDCFDTNAYICKTPQIGSSQPTGASVTATPPPARVTTKSPVVTNKPAGTTKQPVVTNPPVTNRQVVTTRTPATNKPPVTNAVHTAPTANTAKNVGNANPSSGTSLGTGAIAGIVVGAVVIVALLVAVLFMLNRYVRIREHTRLRGAAGFDNATYNNDKEKVNFADSSET